MKRPPADVLKAASGGQKFWRLRVPARIGEALRPGSYAFPGCTIAVSELQGSVHGERNVLLDLVHDPGALRVAGDLLGSYRIAFDHLNRFLDRVAFVGCCGAALGPFLCYGPPTVKVGSVFSLMIPGPGARRQSREIEAADIPTTQFAAGYDKALSLLRRATNTRSAEERLLALYSALERVAEVESKEKTYPRCQKCKEQLRRANCQDQVVTGLATWNYIRKALVKEGLPSEFIDAFRKLRNQVAHGQATRNADFLFKVEECAQEVMGRAFSIVAIGAQLTVKNPNSIVAVEPLMHLRLRVMKDDFHFVSSVALTRLVASGLKTRAFEAKDVDWGSWVVPRSPAVKWNLNPLVWPEVQAPPDRRSKKEQRERG